MSLVISLSVSEPFGGFGPAQWAHRVEIEFMTDHDCLSQLPERGQ